MATETKDQRIGFMEERKNLNGWVACRIPPADKVALKELAQDRGTTVSVVMRALIEQATAAAKGGR